MTLPNWTDPTHTNDGIPVELGLRVHDYDWNWGTVESGPDVGGWWNIALNDGGRSYMDGPRLSVRGWNVGRAS